MTEASTEVHLIGRAEPFFIVGTVDEVLAKLRADEWASLELRGGGGLTVHVPAVASVRELVVPTPEQAFPTAHARR